MMGTIDRLKELEAKAKRCGATVDDHLKWEFTVFEALPKLLAFVAAWDDCQTVTASQMEKMCILLSARKALDES